MKKKYVAPSVLSADFLNLGRDIETLNTSNADFIHIDVMDGSFVPNISFGFPVLKAIAQQAKKPLDVHLMIENPDKYIERFASEGADMISVHYETCPHLNRCIDLIKQQGAKAGVVLNPHTPVFFLEEIIPFIDYVLLMTVNPGFGGQKFIPTSYDKIKKLKSMVNTLNPDVLIEVDGGVNKSNAAELYKSGVDILVAGSAVFSEADILKAINDLKEAE